MERSKVKIIIIFFVLILSIKHAYAQEERKSNWTLSTGFVTAVEPDPFENTAGFHLGANLFKANAKRIAWDSQLSLNFISSNFESAVVFAVLGGGRIYFNGSDNKNRYFFNALVGPSLYLGSGDDYIEQFMQVGYSGGFYANIKRFLFGIGLERQEVLAFKIGYQL